MTVKNITPIDIFSALFDGRSVDYIAGITPLDNFSKTLEMAKKAVNAFLKEAPTPQDQKDVHEVLQLIFDGDNAHDLEQDYGINFDDADAYMAVIHKSYNI